MTMWRLPCDGLQDKWWLASQFTQNTKISEDADEREEQPMGICMHKYVGSREDTLQ